MKSKKRLPEVSVIIPVLNGEITISQQLDALGRQSFTGDWELIVADNGSTDSTIRVVKQHPLGEKISVSVVDASENKGINFARNAGTLAAKGELILFCDSDDVVTSEWISYYVLSSEHASMCVFAGPLSPIKGAKAPAISTGFYLSSAKVTGQYSWGWGANFGFSRAAWDTVSGFNEAYKGGFDEVDFQLRAQKAGCRFHWVEGAEVGYRLPNDGRRVAVRAIKQGVMSRKMAKDHPDIFPEPRLVTCLLSLTLGMGGFLSAWIGGRPTLHHLHRAGFNLGILRARASSAPAD